MVDFADSWRINRNYSNKEKENSRKGGTLCKSLYKKPGPYGVFKKQGEVYHQGFMTICGNQVSFVRQTNKINPDGFKQKRTCATEKTGDKVV